MYDMSKYDSLKSRRLAAWLWLFRLSVHRPGQSHYEAVIRARPWLGLFEVSLAMLQFVEATECDWRDVSGK